MLKRMMGFEKKSQSNLKHVSDTLKVSDTCSFPNPDKALVKAFWLSFPKRMDKAKYTSYAFITILQPLQLEACVLHRDSVTTR